MNPDAAGLWSLVFTPIFGSVLVWRNWKALGEAAKAQWALLWLVASIVFNMLISLSGRRFFALVCLIVWYFGCQRPQTLFVKKTWPEGYPAPPLAPAAPHRPRRRARSVRARRGRRLDDDRKNTLGGLA